MRSKRMTKNFLITMILLTLFMVSCSNTGPKNKTILEIQKQESIEDILSDYMSPDDVVSGILQSNDDSKLQFSDPELRLRMDGLNDDTEFLKDTLGKKPDPVPLMEKSLQASDGADFRAFNTSVKSQNNGLCTAYATVGAIESTLCKTLGRCSENLSEQHLFQRQGRRYSTDAAVKTASLYRIVDEALWPQYGKPVSNVNSKGNAKIVQYRYLGKDAQALMDAHDRGNYVVIGMKTPKDMLNCRATIRTTTGFSSGGHAILSSGYQLSDKIPGGMYAIIKNSWGKNCGDNGYQYVPLKDICNKNGSYCFYYEVVTVDTNKDDIDIIPDPNAKPVIVPYCRPITFKFWTRRFWNQSKDDRCYRKCEANCKSICGGLDTCEFPWR